MVPGSVWERRSRWRLLCFLFALCSWPSLGSPARAAPPPEWTVAPEPDWVEDIAGPANPGFASGHPIDGLAYELTETQQRFAGGEEWSYGRTVVRIVSEAGAEAAGQQTFEFGPPNERLILHRVEIHRGDDTRPRLREADVQLLQREADLDQQIYSNRRTAYILIPDLRVGDVLEYSWSIVGSNPVLDGHVLTSASMVRSAAVGTIYSRVLSDRPLNVKAFGVPPPVEDRQGKLFEYTTRADSVVAAPQIANLPVEETFDGWIQFTDFSDWSSVARWGMALFDTEEVDPAVVALLEELDLHGQTPEAQLLRVLQWVQSNIRYFSTPFAQNTHRPATPGEVLERRYGDCKDVALLTVVMLDQLGIGATVALVDADQGQMLPEMLPSPFAFDHAVVVAFPEETPLWVDPTRSHQRGSLEQVAARNLHWALPLTPGLEKLVVVQEPPPEGPEVLIEADYHSRSFEEPATLEIRAVYAGELADTLRYLHETQDEAAFSDMIEDGLGEKLRRSHPAAEAAGALQYADDTANNRIELRRSYSLPKFWVLEGGQYTTSVDAFSLYESVSSPEPGRTAPLALPHPQHRIHRTTLDLHDEFPFDDDETVLTPAPLR